MPFISDGFSIGGSASLRRIAVLDLPNFISSIPSSKLRSGELLAAVDPVYSLDSLCRPGS